MHYLMHNAQCTMRREWGIKLKKMHNAQCIMHNEEREWVMKGLSNKGDLGVIVHYALCIVH